MIFPFPVLNPVGPPCTNFKQEIPTVGLETQLGRQRGGHKAAEHGPGSEGEAHRGRTRGRAGLFEERPLSVLGDRRRRRLPVLPRRPPHGHG